MGVYINGMAMPICCCNCPLAKLSPTGETLICNYTLSTVPWDDKPFDCPLVPVPPHGRLIDADALRESFRESIEECHKWADEMRESGNEEMVIRAEQSLGTFVECSLRAKNAPTIIPAEEGMA